LKNKIKLKRQLNKQQKRGFDYEANWAEPKSETTCIGGVDDSTVQNSHNTTTTTTTITIKTTLPLSPNHLVRTTLQRQLHDHEQQRRTRSSERYIQAETGPPIQGPQGPQEHGPHPQIPRR
jgi:hypothetical protein